MSPFLRPPRKAHLIGNKYDPLDYARAVAEAIQAAMRIVRKPIPDEPKLIALEYVFKLEKYYKYMPKWFVETIIRGVV